MRGGCLDAHPRGPHTARHKLQHAHGLVKSPTLVRGRPATQGRASRERDRYPSGNAAAKTKGKVKKRSRARFRAQLQRCVLIGCGRNGRNKSRMKSKREKNVKTRSTAHDLPGLSRQGGGCQQLPARLHEANGTLFVDRGRLVQCRY